MHSTGDERMTEALSKAEDHSREYSEVLSNLTIVVPTYNRHLQVLKTINFWRGRGPELLILDGSPTPLALDQEHESMEGLIYLHIPETFQSRIVQSGTHITTDYVALSGDDEVQMPSSLAASIAELERNADLASCLGWAVGFSTYVAEGSEQQLNGYSCYPKLQFLHNTHESVEHRWYTHLSSYVPSNIYSVVRANAYKNALKLIDAPGDRVGGQLELEFEIAILYQGGNKVLPNMHWLRNFGDSSNYTHDPDNNPAKMFYQCFLSPKLSSWRQEFLSTRAEVLAEIDGQDVKLVRAWLENALQRYSEICDGIYSSNLTTKERSVRFIRRNLRAAVPAKHRGKVRNLLNLTRRSDPTLSLQDMAEELSLLGMNYSEEELQQVITERLQ